MREQETIAQIVTAPGRGAVGVVRISGPMAREIGAAVYQGKADIAQSESHRIHYGWVCNAQGSRIDEALFMTMWTPRSYTGEDVVEIQCHGGYAATTEVLQAVLAAGALAAEAGEFTRRAFLNGKLDFTRAEAIMDIVDARSQPMLQLATQQKSGYLEEEVQSFREELLTLIAYIQADLDYPDDDIERLSEEAFLARSGILLTRLEELLASAERGRIYREGVRVAIAGRPNVGKSSLLNALVGRSSAIVTDIPGTTRDVVRDRFVVGGLTVEILDTAGLRVTEDLVESMGVERAYETAQKADIILYVLSPEHGFAKEDQVFFQQQIAEKMIIVHNKIDLNLPIPTLPSFLATLPAVHLSAAQGEGLQELEKILVEKALAGTPEAADSFYLTNVRHIGLIELAQKDLTTFAKGIKEGIPSDLLVIDLQHAWETMGLITGDTASDSLLDEIFSKFCLGK